MGLRDFQVSTFRIRQPADVPPAAFYRLELEREGVRCCSHSGEGICSRHCGVCCGVPVITTLEIDQLGWAIQLLGALSESPVARTCLLFPKTSIPFATHSSHACTTVTVQSDLVQCRVRFPWMDSQRPAGQLRDTSICSAVYVELDIVAVRASQVLPELLLIRTPASILASSRSRT